MVRSSRKTPTYGRYKVGTTYKGVLHCLEELSVDRAEDGALGRKLLILTAGTNPPAIASVLTRVKEIFDYTDAVILATSASRRDAERALELLRADGLITRVLIVIDEKLMNSLVSSTLKGMEITMEGIRKYLNEKCEDFEEVYVDITGGTKLMSSATALSANSVKAMQGSTKVLRPCDSTRLCLGYLTHLELSHNALSWWSRRLCSECGYYPKVPRVLEVPWNVDLDSWNACDEDGRPLPPPKELPHPLFQYGKTLEPLIKSLGYWTWLINSATFSKLKVPELGISVEKWGSLDVNKPEPNHEAFKRERGNNSISLAPISGLRRIRVSSVSDRSKAEEMIKLFEGAYTEGMGLWEFLLMLRLSGYTGPVYLDTNVLMYGFHNELFRQDMVASLMGHEVYGRELNITVPRCVFYEALRIYEEKRKYRNTANVANAIEFITTSVASMVAKHFVKDVGPTLSFCDPALHELVSKGGILITADSGLFDNIKNDASVQGIAVKVDNYEGSELSYGVFSDLVKAAGYEVNDYVRAVEKLAEAASKHAAIVQALMYFMSISDIFGVKNIRIIGDREIIVRRNNAMFSQAFVGDR